jgi:hypothetical protein
MPSSWNENSFDHDSQTSQMNMRVMGEKRVL